MSTSFSPVMSIILLLACIIIARFFLVKVMRKHPVARVYFETFLGAVLFQFVAYLSVGFLDPFWQIAFVVSIPVGLLLALVLEAVLPG